MDRCHGCHENLWNEVGDMCVHMNMYMYRYIYVHVYFTCEHVIISSNKALSQSLWCAGNSCKNTAFNTRGRWHQKVGGKEIKNIPMIEGMMNRKASENYGVCVYIPKQECASCPESDLISSRPVIHALCHAFPSESASQPRSARLLAPWTRL